MNKTVVFLLVIAAVVGGIWWMRSTQRPSETPLPGEPGAPQPLVVRETIDVTASNNRFEPQDFDVVHWETIPLAITAVDKDYTFILEDFGMNVPLPKGQTTAVELVGQGVGTFEYRCGPSCTGTVVVSPEPDVGEEF